MNDNIFVLFKMNQSKTMKKIQLNRPIRILSMVLVISLTTLIISCKKDNIPDKPNIVLILVENISTEIKCYGDPYVSTPNVDELASQGIRYTNAFTTSSVCAPSRAAMMTCAYQIKTNTQNLRMNRDRHLPSPYRAITHYLREAGYYTALGCGYSPKTDMNFAAREGEYFGFDGKNWTEREEGQPFFAQITLNITHRGDHWYEEDPPFNLEELILPPEIPDHPVCRDDYARYLAQIQKMDTQTGEIIHRLEEEGLTDNTMVIWIADNGADLIRGMNWLYDFGIHVPMIIRWPGNHVPGTVHEELVSSLDAIASILYAAGAEIPEHMDGNPIFQI